MLVSGFTGGALSSRSGGVRRGVKAIVRWAAWADAAQESVCRTVTKLRRALRFDASLPLRPRTPTPLAAIRASAKLRPLSRQSRWLDRFATPMRRKCPYPFILSKGFQSPDLVLSKKLLVDCAKSCGQDERIWVVFRQAGLPLPAPAAALPSPALAARFGLPRLRRLPLFARPRRSSSAPKLRPGHPRAWPLAAIAKARARRW